MSSKSERILQQAGEAVETTIPFSKLRESASQAVEENPRAKDWNNNAKELTVSNMAVILAIIDLAYQGNWNLVLLKEALYKIEELSGKKPKGWKQGMGDIFSGLRRQLSKDGIIDRTTLESILAESITIVQSGKTNATIAAERSKNSRRSGIAYVAGRSSSTGGGYHGR